MSKKFKSRWFRIATEGATTDGRKIERSWIEDMAATYSPSTYGARINCEHIKGLAPDSMFGAFGDVLALKAEEVELNGVKKLGLFAQIQPNDDLLALNAKRKKIYTSMEVHPKLEATGKPYLTGLALTDSPASLGTEALEFSAKHGIFASRKEHPEILFTVAEEVTLEFDEVTDQPDEKTAGLFSRVMATLGKFKEKEGKDAALFNELGQAVEAIADHVAEQGQAFAAEVEARTALQAALDKLTADFTALSTKLSQQPSGTTRPLATGGEGHAKTEF